METRTLPLAFQPEMLRGPLMTSGAEAPLAGHLSRQGPVPPSDIEEAVSRDPNPPAAMGLEGLNLEDLRLDIPRMAAEGADRGMTRDGPRRSASIFRSRCCAVIRLWQPWGGRAGGGYPGEPCGFRIDRDGVSDSVVDGLTVVARLRMAGGGQSLDDAERRQGGRLQAANLPITEVKIDLEIRAPARRRAKLRSIFGSIGELWRRLGLFVVAEDVETRDDLALVRSLPVDYVQGYPVSRKLLFPDLLAMLAACPLRGPLVSVDNAASAP